MYERRIFEVEHGSFTPLVLFTTGRWNPSAQVTFKRLANLTSVKQEIIQPNHKCDSMQDGLLPLIESAVMCLRGARSSFHKPIKSLDLADTPVDLIVDQGRI